jgi:hypothetical protein
MYASFIFLWICMILSLTFIHDVHWKLFLKMLSYLHWFEINQITTHLLQGYVVSLWK